MTDGNGITQCKNCQKMTAYDRPECEHCGERMWPVWHEAWIWFVCLLPTIAMMVVFVAYMLGLTR